MKTLLLLLALVAFAAAGGIAQTDAPFFSGKIDTKYDDAKNESTIEFRNIPMTGSPKYNGLNLSVSYPGKKLSARQADVIFMITVANASGHRYPDINSVVLQSGDSELGEIILLNLDRRAFTGTDILETLGTRIPFKIFRKLAAAKKPVIFRVAETTFIIPATSIAHVADYVNALDP
jgi:hypothetical protein